MLRGNPYEAAFEAYLQAQRLCYVAVHEGRRTFLGNSRVKNLDFIVHGEGGLGLLVDIKGRRYPGGPPGKPRRVWESWATEDDVDGLARWAEIFGQGYCGLFVFAYRLAADVEPALDLGDLWEYRGERFLLRAVTVDDYRDRQRVRSPRWNTVALSSEDFKATARPFRYFTREYHPTAEGLPF